ncbi:DUF434 domain-containing protein [Clostridium tertium]|uniref:DUF434 domain-containing protein n=1 Tax=Clostridium tertium TaxID=1559 RepID=A0A6N2YRW3_9CLOT
MSKAVRRGYIPTDEKDFKGDSLNKLYKASEDLIYLLNRGYKLKGSSTFIGNHYLLSERQRLSLARGISKDDDIRIRKSKEISDLNDVNIVHIDGFNTIITLEVALSNSLVIKSMDGTIRDLAGLRGTYSIIDKTENAINLIKDYLVINEIDKAIFYLDKPVSNSGRLKIKILDIFKGSNLEIEVEVLDKVDSILKSKENVVSSDAIILDNCISWINLNRYIIENSISNNNLVNFIKFND